MDQPQGILEYVRWLSMDIYPYTIIQGSGLCSENFKLCDELILKMFLLVEKYDGGKFIRCLHGTRAKFAKKFTLIRRRLAVISGGRWSSGFLILGAADNCALLLEHKGKETTPQTIH